MTRRILTACAVLTAAGAGCADDKPPAGPAKPGTDRTAIYEKVEVRDRANLNGGVAYTIPKPKGWKHEGSVAWSPLENHQANIKARVWNPDTLEQVSTPDWRTFAYLKNPGFPVRPFGPFYYALYCEPLSPTEFHAAWFKHLGAAAPGKIVAQKDLPELAAAYAKTTGMKVRAGKTRVAYKVGEAEVEEDHYLVLQYESQELPAGTMHVFSPVTQPLALRAAKGKLDEATPRLAAIGHAIQPTTEYGVALLLGLAGLRNVEMTRQAAIDAWSKAISANNDAMLAMIRHERQARWAREDRAARDFSDYIRGVERRTDGRIEHTVPNTHKHAWSDRNGTIYLTDDPADDPNRHQNGTWTLLKSQ